MARRSAGWRTIVIWLAMAWAVAAALAADGAAVERQAMLEDIKLLARTLGGSTDARVLAAMGRVPRHEFVPWTQRPFAYDNRPLPIGHGQTISQPYIVAAMTALLNVGAGDTVLEIGTGSGYQAAVLAELGATVATVEIVEPLAIEATERLRRLGYAAVTTRVGDGYEGWPERAPFAAIMVTAAASHVPPPLVRQLKPGGRMVIPVGATFQVQLLLLVEKQQDGTVTTRQIMPVRFVPLTGGH
jgi:protein-L-isoaspartate(D-aspartate) O-methyltransferase